MYDKIASDSRVYTDVQSLENLRYESKRNPDAVKTEMAKQFEAILLQMMLRSMRDANKGFKSDLISGEQMDFYQDIYDKQLTLALSNSGIGIAEAIERNIDQHNVGVSSKYNLIPNSHPAGNLPSSNSAGSPRSMDVLVKQDVALDSVKPDSPIKDTINTTFTTQEEFVTNLWPAAKVAADRIGAKPEILLAQAALETNWGKKIIPYGKNESTYNLFNIKADSSWSNKSTLRDSLEQRNGVLVKEKSSFRSYDSFMDSFLDYASFLKQNPRYSEALNKAPDPHKFVRELQNAGYATDSAYADKVLKIFSSSTFKDLIGKMR